MKMKALEVRGSKEPPITLEILAEAEKTLGFPLPQGYRQFLLLHNGGCPKQNIYGFSACNRESEIYCFYSIYDGDNGVNLFTEIYRYRDDIPSEFIPIGYDGGGSQVCLGVRPPYVNQVYFWDFDKAPGWMDPNFGDPPTMEFMYPLASSFEEFINKLFGVEFKDNPNSTGHSEWLRYHDRYSYPLSPEARDYGPRLTDFFDQAPSQVECFIMEPEKEENAIHLWYIDSLAHKKYYRIIYKDGRVIDAIESTDLNQNS